MRLTRLVALPVLLFLFATSAIHAGTVPNSWIDVTSLPYGADNTCSMNAGPAINSAIADATHAIAPGVVIFFPAGCYLINTPIIDINTSVGPSVNDGPEMGITYLGIGHVQLLAGPGLTGSIMQFGNDPSLTGGQLGTHTIQRRKISNLFFDCNHVSGVDGIRLDGLFNSEFDDVEIRYCTGIALRTMGGNSANYQNVFNGGLIGADSDGGDGKTNGVYLGDGANHWTFNGTIIAFDYTRATSSGYGIDFEEFGNACISCNIAGWKEGLWANQNGTNHDRTTGLSVPVAGLEISGGYYENNSFSNIQVGYQNLLNAKVQGVSIHGAFINGSSNTQYCVELEQADGFSIAGNTFKNCVINNIRALPDFVDPPSSSFEGADNGIVGPNTYIGSATNHLLGSNITEISGGQITQINSTNNCSSSAAPAPCGSSASGSVTIPAGSTFIVVDTTAVTAKSQILVTFDSSLGTRLGVTCDTTFTQPLVIARSAGANFRISIPSAPASNPACLNYLIIN